MMLVSREDSVLNSWPSGEKAESSLINGTLLDKDTILVIGLSSGKFPGKPRKLTFLTKASHPTTAEREHPRKNHHAISYSC